MIFYSGTLWTRGTDDYGFHRSHRSASAWAVFIWVLYGVVRPIWVTAWVIGRIRTLRTKIRLVGRKACMQTDLNTVLGRYRPERLRDSSGRPRFCKWNLGSTGCFDGGRPLGDRVYHCSYVNEKCEKDQQLRGIHLPVYDHYCNWIGITVYLMTVKVNSISPSRFLSEANQSSFAILAVPSCLKLLNSGRSYDGSLFGRGNHLVSARLAFRDVGLGSHRRRLAGDRERVSQVSRFSDPQHYATGDQLPGEKCG